MRERVGWWIGGGQPDDQRIQRIVAGGWHRLDGPIRVRIAGRWLVGRGHQGDQDVLRVDDEVAHQIPDQPARASRRRGEFVVRQLVDGRMKRGRGTREEIHRTAG